MKQTVSFISLGCAKNQVDCEQMMYLMAQAGYEICPEPENVDLVIVNTCGFIDAAKSEAIDHILAVGQKKAEGLVGKLLVTGCLAQRYQQEILTELPEVDGVLGTGSYYDIVAAAGQVLSGSAVQEFGSIHAPVEETGRILTTPAHYSYLKIAEGCDNHCAFCVIPKLRGKYRSRKLEDVVAEAERLAENGTKELIVVAQDTSRYGLDLYEKRMLAELLRRLCRIDGLHWIRVHYTYPDEFTDELIDTVADEPKIVKYLDIPIQHVNDGILKKMNRRGNKAYLEELFAKLRARIPGLVIRKAGAGRCVCLLAGGGNPCCKDELSRRRGRAAPCGFYRGASVRCSRRIQRLLLRRDDGGAHRRLGRGVLLRSHLCGFPRH